MQPKRPPASQDPRFRYDAHGRQRGRNWTGDGLENPVDPVVDTPNEQLKARGEDGWTR